MAEEVKNDTEDSTALIGKTKRTRFLQPVRLLLGRVSQRPDRRREGEYRVFPQRTTIENL